MKRILMIALCIALLILPAAAYAEAEGEQWGQVVAIALEDPPAPSEEAEPVANPPVQRNFCEYDWTQGDIDTVAQGYWRWCNTAQEKADFTAVIVNRMLCGLTKSDGSRMFPATAEGVMTQNGEFGIDTAKCSDKNRDLAAVNLNRCMTEWLVGNAGVRVPRSAIYADRVNGVLVMYDMDWTEVWRVEA